ncbi:MAG: hypothetical protein ACLP9N_36830 [Mycobacterium sp.]
MFIVDLFLDWTFIGWVVAVAMAARTGSLNRSDFVQPPDSK